MIDDAKWNSILYYADFLALKKRSYPVTDTCKYFFVYGIPMNISYIAGTEPCYDTEDEYLLKAIEEYMLIYKKFGESGIQSYIEDVGCIHSCGCVDATRMLNCIHYYSDYGTKRHAWRIYNTWKASLTYNHKTTDEEGRKCIKQCTKHINHYENQQYGPY